MTRRRILCILLVCVCFASYNRLSGYAFQVSEDAEITESVVLRASGRFSMAIEPHTYSAAASTFPLSAGASVTISAVYSPSSASVDFGLTNEEGEFCYVNVVSAESGNVEIEIPVEASGNYRLTVRNNSNFRVDVSGLVVY